MLIITLGQEHNNDIFSIFFTKKVCCVFSLESHQRGDSNNYKQYTSFNIKKKVTLNYPTSAATGFFEGTQERVRNSRGKRAIGVRVIEVLLYFKLSLLRNSYTTLCKPIRGRGDNPRATASGLSPVQADKAVVLLFYTTLISINLFQYEVIRAKFSIPRAPIFISRMNSWFQIYSTCT